MVGDGWRSLVLGMRGLYLVDCVSVLVEVLWSLMYFSLSCLAEVRHCRKSLTRRLVDLVSLMHDKMHMKWTNCG